MTAQDLRAEFKEEYPLTEPILLSNSCYGMTYGKWLEQRLVKSLNVQIEWDELMAQCVTDCCPKCGSEDIVTTIYCNKCQEAL